MAGNFVNYPLKAKFVTKLRISGGSNSQLIPIISVKVRFVMFEYADTDGLMNDTGLILCGIHFNDFLRCGFMKHDHKYYFVNIFCFNFTLDI